MILDASVGAEIAIRSQVGKRALEAISEELFTPEIFIAEVHNVLKKMIFTKKISIREANESADVIAELPLTYIHVSQFQAELWNLGLKMSCFDAHYVILAQELHLPILTLDGRLTRLSGVKVNFVLVS
ncbi:MAG: type II toxin-antitoxin system VapC family toxin [Ilumatobacteraceae bacterium]